MTTDTTMRKFTLCGLAAEYPGGIRIPMIQRDYAQGRPSWANPRKRFLTDIRESLMPGGIPLHLDFIYGIKQKEEQTEAFCPLDGQQRLTTLFLLHWSLAARDKCFGKFQGAFRNASDQSTFSQSKFTYQVRPGGRAFFQALVEHAPSADEWKTTKPTVWFRQQWWFRSIWEQDPSVAGALVMLDAIHEHFNDHPEASFRNLIEGDRITFQMLDLEAVGLHDDLYLRMNARGRPLTIFETFKARFDKFLETNSPAAGQLDRCSVKTAKDFANHIDTVWLDFIWNHYGPKESDSEDTSSVDKAFINLFRAVALASLEPTKENAEENITKEDVKKKDAAYVKSLSDGEPDYDDFENGGWLTTNFTTHLIHVLEACEPYKECDSDPERNFILFQSPWFGEGRLLDRVVRHNGKRELADFLQFATCVRFLTAHGPVLDDEDHAEFDELNRVVRNLVLNSEVGADTFLDMLSGLDQLMEGSRKHGGILAFLAGTEEKLPGFNKDQTKEELLKAKLIRLDREGWWPLIEKAENHRYFRGQIDFLLEFSGANLPIQDHADVQNNFRKYLQRAEEMFGEKGLLEEPKDNGYLRQRALLAVGDYLLPDGSLYSFCDGPASSGASWKRLLEKDNDGKRPFLKKLWDRLADYSLQEVAATPTPDLWRTVLCSRVDAWSYCWKRRIRYDWRGDQSPRVFLLRGERRTTNNTYEELHSFCFRNNEGLSMDMPVDTGRFAPLTYSGPGYVSSSYHPHLKFELTYKGANHIFQLYCHCHEDSGFSLRISRQGSDPDFINFLLTDQVGFESETNPGWLGEHLVKRADPADPLHGAALLKTIADALNMAPIQKSS